MSETRKDTLDSAESVRLKLGTQTLGRKELGGEGRPSRGPVRSSPSVFGQILIFMEGEIKNYNLGQGNGSAGKHRCS